MAIARAILSAPQLILFDEPLNGLDENHREQILGHLEKLQQKISLPILYVTHNMEELMRLADRVLVLEQGSLLASKNISDILSDLALPFSQHQQAGVVISAKVHSFDEINHLIELDIGDNQFLWVTSSSTNHLADEEIRLRVYAKDISLTRKPAQDSSILNIIPVKIIGISESGTGQSIIKLKCRKQNFLARLTNKSIKKLSLNIGDEVFAQIKGIAILGSRI